MNGLLNFMMLFEDLSITEMEKLTPSIKCCIMFTMHEFFWSMSSFVSSVEQTLLTLSHMLSVFSFIHQGLETEYMAAKCVLMSKLYTICICNLIKVS